MKSRRHHHQLFLCINFAPCTVSDSSTSYHDWSPTVVRDAYAVKDLHFLLHAVRIRVPILCQQHRKLTGTR